MGNYGLLSYLEPKAIEVQNGVTFHSETYSIDNDRFTNLYWVELERDSTKFKILSSDKPLPLKDFQLLDHNIIASINFGGFYLSDDGYTPSLCCILQSCRK